MARMMYDYKSLKSHFRADFPNLTKGYDIAAAMAAAAGPHNVTPQTSASKAPKGAASEALVPPWKQHQETSLQQVQVLPPWRHQTELPAAGDEGSIARSVGKKRKKAPPSETQEVQALAWTEVTTQAAWPPALLAAFVPEGIKVFKRQYSQGMLPLIVA